MAALAPFIEVEEIDISDWIPSLGVDPPEAIGGPAVPSDSQTIEQEIADRNLLLASQPEIPEDLGFFIDWLADQLIDLPEDAVLRVDPYFLVAAQRALLGSLRALDSDDTAWARRQMRFRLEQLRQVYRDLAEGEAVYEGRPAKEVAQWLAEVLDTPQVRLAELLGVSARTFQRWVSQTDPAGPEGDEARRVRVIAGAANHLRHAFTGPGVVRWFGAPNSQLNGLRPLDLLDDVDSASRLATLAASARSHTAA
jgi:hypothetical protein